MYEMRKRLNAMRELLKANAKTDSIESKMAELVFNEYFTFEWDGQNEIEYEQE